MTNKTTKGTKEQIAQLLEQCGDEYISGSTLADRLGLTRSAVWKCIKQLVDDGYEVESSRQGYRLGPDSDAVSENSIRTYLEEDARTFDIEVFPEIGSTNSYLKEKASLAQQNGTQDGLRSWHTVIASAQSAGRGRRGRTFVSPPKTGLYLSVLLYPDTSAAQATRITTAAAVAACHAIEVCTDRLPLIKWVNDIFVDGKKTCGILTEASFDLESGKPDWIVMGIGFNVYEPRGGFPPQLKDIAGAITTERSRDLRSRIAASFLKEFHAICVDLENASFSDEYRKRSFLIGRKIYVINGEMNLPATAIDIDDECRLIVRYEDGTVEALSSGEVSVRVTNDKQ